MHMGTLRQLKVCRDQELRTARAKFLCSLRVPLRLAFIDAKLLGMTSAAQSWLQVVLIIVGIGASLVGAIVYQTHYIDKRLDDLIRYLDVRFKALEDRLENLEHPVSRP